MTDANQFQKMEELQEALKNFKLTKDNHFVAMEYYALILNRTFLVLITKDHLIAIKGNGPVAEGNSNNELANKIARPLVIENNLENPYSYLKQKYIRQFEHEDFSPDSIVSNSKISFVIDRASITDARHDPKKKWGMGLYPHDGKVYVRATNHRKRELIILGSQSGSKIASLIMKK